MIPGPGKPVHYAIGIVLVTAFAAACILQAIEVAAEKVAKGKLHVR